MKKIALKWTGEEYVNYDLPDGASRYEKNMEKEISCCCCGKRVKYGECYTSRTILDDIGIGYAECEDCYKDNWIKYMKRAKAINAIRRKNKIKSEVKDDAKD